MTASIRQIDKSLFCLQFAFLTLFYLKHLAQSVEEDLVEDRSALRC